MTPKGSWLEKGKPGEFKKTPGLCLFLAFGLELLAACHVALGCGKFNLTQADGFRGYFDQLVVADEVHGPFKGHGRMGSGYSSSLPEARMLVSFSLWWG